jgi:hypothetical protein
MHDDDLELGLAASHLDDAESPPLGDPESDAALTEDPDRPQQVNFRMPASAVEGLRRLADRSGLSLPQFVAHHMTEVLLEDRAALRAEFEAAAARARAQEKALDESLAKLERQHEATARRIAGTTKKKRRSRASAS